MEKLLRIGHIDFGDDEKKAVVCLISDEEPQLTMGRNVQRFESVFAGWIGTKYAIAVNSGTSALIIAINAAINVAVNTRQPKIFTTSLTYPATWNAAQLSGRLRFMDINPRTLNMMLPKSSCDILLPVHLFGKPLHGLDNMALVVEDAAQALGSKIANRKVGSIGVAGCFSFYVAHQINTIEGGMVVTNDKEVADICRMLRDNGRICICPVCALKTKGVCKRRGEYNGEIRWVSEYVGWNMKMTEIQAAIGLVKMEKVDRIVERRHEILQIYNEELAHVGRLIEEDDEYICPLAYPIIVDDPRIVIHKLADRGVEARGMFPFRGNYPNAQYISEHGLFIPCHHKLSDNDVTYIISSVKEALS